MEAAVTQVIFHRAFPEVSLPCGAHYDILSPFDVLLRHHDYVTIRTGLIAEIAQGFQLHVFSKYTLAKTRQVVVLNSPAIIHAGSTDEIDVILENRSLVDFQLREGDAIAQVALVKVIPFMPVFADANDIRTVEVPS